MPAGRPTKYDPKFAAQAEKLCRLGATDMELAEFFEVHPATIYRWASANPEFCESLKVGKQEADDRVERSLYMKAVGFERQEVKIFMPANAEKPVYAPFLAYHAPDTTAALFWLKNRRPAEWRDKQEIDHRSPDGTMTPKGIDASGLSDAALSELMRAKRSHSTD